MILLWLFVASLTVSNARADNHKDSPHWALKPTVSVSASVFARKTEAGYHLLPVADGDVGLALDLELLQRKLVLQVELGVGHQWHFETEGVRPSLQLPLSLAALWRVQERVLIGLGGVVVFTDGPNAVAGAVFGPAIDIAVSCNNSVGGIIGGALEIAPGHSLPGASTFLRWAFGPTKLCHH